MSVLNKYSPGKSGRHVIAVTLMHGEYHGELFLETGGDERGKSIIESAFDFLDYPEIIIEDDCYFEYDKYNDTFSVFLHYDMLNGNLAHFYLEDLSRQDIADMIVDVRIVDYFPD